MPSLFRRRACRRPPYPDVLTPAEWRVLDEVREGQSNLEIAERLGISRNTVKTHIARIRDKLNVRDRNDLAGWRGKRLSAAASFALCAGALLMIMRRPPRTRPCCSWSDTSSSDLAAAV